MNNYINFIKTFVKENKNYIIAALLYTVFCIFLFVITPISESEKQIFIQSAKEYVEKIITNNHLQLFLNIFFNNSFIALIVFLSGFMLSFLSIFIVLSNIFVVWIVLSFSIEKVWLLTSLLAILPHGIIEISAILFSLALSFKLTHLVVKKVWNRKKYKIWWEIKKSFQFFWSIILWLLLIAAFIESFITPLFLWKF